MTKDDVYLTEAQVVDLIQDAVNKAPSINKWSKANGIHRPNVTSVLNDNKPPGPTICATVNVEKTWRGNTPFYRRLDGGACGD